MDPAARDAILKELLGALEGGKELDLDGLKRRHPGHEAMVERLFGAASSYRALSSTLLTSSREAQALLAGDRLGDFEIVGLLSRGGMSVVYRARQLSLGGREVALKVLPAGLQSEEAKRRFRREALSLASLHHPCLSEVHGFGEERGLLFYAMRLIEGPTLRDVLERLRSLGPCAAAEAARRRRAFVAWIAQVASALAEVHAEGLVHRDVKLTNVLVAGGNEPTLEPPSDAGAGEAVLVDFGLVRAIDGGAVTTSGFSATPSYAPPEQLLGREVDARADVFSLGATLHDLVTGRLPHERIQASAGLERLRTLVPDVDLDLEALVAKAVEREERWRYPDALAFREDLDAWLAGREVSARRPSARERTQRWLRQDPTRSLRTLACLALGALALAWVGTEFVHAALAANRAREARERTDYVALITSLREIPRPFAWIALRDRELVEFADRARRSNLTDPLFRVFAQLRAGDAEGALLEAATHLRVSGFDSEPSIARYFMAGLRGELPASSADVAEEQQRSALRFAARLAYERPSTTAALARESAELRAAILERFAHREVSFEERHLCLTALAGWGRTEDVPMLVRWFASRKPVSEDQRLALQALDWIVRRAHAIGGLDEVEWSELWSALAPQLRSHYAWPNVDASGRSWGSRAAVQRATLALLFAQRAATGSAPDLNTLVPPAELAALDPSSIGFTQRMLAAAGDRRLAEVLASGAPFREGGAREWGWSCGAFGDAELTRTAREACARSAEGERLLLEFDAGLASGEAERHGRIDDYLLDEDTLLGAPSSDPEPHALQTQVFGDEQDEREIASWEFLTSPVGLRGAATGVEAKLAELTPEVGGHFLRFGAFGASEARLQFVVAEGAGESSWTLHLEHLSASRPYYPMQGEVGLAVLLDGKPLVQALFVSSESVERRDLPLPFELLDAGPHVIALRVLRSSTTTYRLSRARLVRGSAETR